MENAFEFVRAHGGVTKAAYPYRAANGTCDNARHRRAPLLVAIDGHQMVPVSNEDALAHGNGAPRWQWKTDVFIQRRDLKKINCCIFYPNIINS
jgi:hypothetical protein